VNQVKEPLKSDLLNGKWELLYTTSESILQPQVPSHLKKKKKICSVQACNTLRIKTKNDSCVVRLTFQIVKFCSLTDAEAKVSEAVWDDLPSNQY
jgi:hypothetical protein